MAFLEVERFRELLHEGVPGFDVRTPGEYEKGHIQGVVNLPLFSNAERVKVGTLYKQQGRQDAILEGLEVVGPKMRALVEEVEAHRGAQSGPVLVHCWRGGMRSESVAWLLRLYGFEALLLKGGYKSYRRWVVQGNDDPPAFQVLGGPTGVGKTAVLQALKSQGEAVLDLEGLANHRGSVFGGLGQPAQPSQEHFENLLGERIDELRKMNKTIWVEDESRMIGMCCLPGKIMEAKKKSTYFRLQSSTEKRLDRLVEEYGRAREEELVKGFQKIQKSLGGQRTIEATRALESGNLREAARLALQYYDKAYEKGLSRKEEGSVIEIQSEGSPEEIAALLIERAESGEDRVDFRSEKGA